MSAPHLHLLLSDLAVLGVICGLALLTGGLLEPSEEIKKAALLLFVLAWGAAIAVYSTAPPGGSPILTFSEQRVSLSLALISLLGALALLELLRFRTLAVPATATAPTMVLALLTIASLAYGWVGGQSVRGEPRLQLTVPAYLQD